MEQIENDIHYGGHFWHENKIYIMDTISNETEELYFFFKCSW